MHLPFLIVRTMPVPNDGAGQVPAIRGEIPNFRFGSGAGNSLSGPLRHPGARALFTGHTQWHVFPGGPCIKDYAK